MDWIKALVLGVVFLVICYGLLVFLYHTTGRAAYEKWVEGQEQLRKLRERSKRSKQ